MQHHHSFTGLVIALVLAVSSTAIAQQVSIKEFQDWFIVNSDVPGTETAGVVGARATAESQELLTYLCTKDSGLCMLSMTLPVQCTVNKEYAVVFAERFPATPENAAFGFAKCRGQNPMAPTSWIYVIGPQAATPIKALIRRSASLGLNVEQADGIYQTRFSMAGSSTAMRTLEMNVLGRAVP